MEKLNPFSNVPLPIWNEILDNLNAKELVIASQVSKKWKDIALSDTLWKKNSQRGNKRKIVCNV